MLALCLMLCHAHYALNYAVIIGKTLLIIRLMHAIVTVLIEYVTVNLLLLTSNM